MYKRSTVYPNKIVIVYSGLDITNLINKYQEIFDIELIYSPIANQSVQKSLGISFLGVEFKWVLFLDDDLVLESSTIEILVKNYLDNAKYSSYAGFGLGILNRSKREINSFILQLLKFFKLYSSTPGVVLKSGHVQSYLDFNEEIYGREVTLKFHHYIRGEEKYNTIEELKSAIEKDVMKIKYFSN